MPEMVQVEYADGIFAYQRVDGKPIGWAVVRKGHRYKSLWLKAGQEYPLYTDLAVMKAMDNPHVMVLGQQIIESWQEDYGR